MNAMDSGTDVFPKEEAKVVEQERLQWKSLQWKQKLMSMMEEVECNSHSCTMDCKAVLLQNNV